MSYILIIIYHIFVKIKLILFTNDNCLQYVVYTGREKYSVYDNL